MRLDHVLGVEKFHRIHDGVAARSAELGTVVRRAGPVAARPAGPEGRAEAGWGAEPASRNARAREAGPTEEVWAKCIMSNGSERWKGA